MTQKGRYQTTRKKPRAKERSGLPETHLASRRQLEERESWLSRKRGETTRRRSDAGAASYLRLGQFTLIN